MEVKMVGKKYSAAVSVLLILAFAISNPIFAQTLGDEIRDDLNDVSSEMQFSESAMEVYVESYKTAKKEFDEERRIVEKRVEAERLKKNEALAEAKRKLAKEKENRRNKREEKKNSKGSELVISTLPKNRVKEEAQKLEKNGRTKSANFPQPGQIAKGKLTIAQIRKIFHPGVPASELNAQQRKELLKNYLWLLKNKVTIATLVAIIRAEGAIKGGAERVVGFTPKKLYGNKTKECRRLIKPLNLSKQSTQQNSSQGCFIKTPAGPSSAGGYFQLVHFRTFRELKNQFGFKNFSRQTQALAALELIRRSHSGAFIALVKNNPEHLDQVMEGTGDWGGSDRSKLRGTKRPILKYAKEEMKKLKDQNYYQGWLDEFVNDRNS